MRQRLTRPGHVPSACAIDRVERALIEILGRNRKPVDTYELTALVFDVKPDRSGRIEVNDAQLTSVRRALLNLKRAGKAVDMGRRWHGGRRRWASERVGVTQVRNKRGGGFTAKDEARLRAERVSG